MGEKNIQNAGTEFFQEPLNKTQMNRPMLEETEVQNLADE
jgi:hypothetical protein